MERDANADGDGTADQGRTPDPDENADRDERGDPDENADPVGNADPGTATDPVEARERAAAGDERSPVDDRSRAGDGREPEALDPRVRIRWLVRAAVVAGLVVALLVAVDRLVISLGPAVVAGAAGVALAAGAWHAVALYRDWRFAIEADALFLERGVVTRVETAVPYVRIQHVDTRRGPIDRALGLSSVVVYTAGSRGADVTVPGLAPERARALRNELRELAVESEPEDAV